jgi:GntR family transcriptional regulator
MAATKQKMMYQIIEDDLKELIDTGKLKQGDLVESENTLKDKYSVSRMTVRQALNNMVNSGYLYRHKGKGTFVSNTKIEKKIYGLVGFSEEMKSINRVVSNQIVSFKLIEATEKVANRLSIQPGDKVYYLRRVRLGDDIPILYEELYFPQSLFPKLDKKVFTGSFYNHIESVLAYRIGYCTQKIEARLATKPVSDLLQINDGEALLYVSIVTCLENGRPFEYGRGYYRSDQYRFVQRSFR